MNINTVRNLSFGKIYVAEKFKDRASEVFESLRKKSP